MNQEVQQSEAASLEQRIQLWMEDNPDRAHAGERMLEQLHRIRSEFTGETAIRLEALVDETLTRQLRIDESRRAGLEAAKRLSKSVEALTASMSACLATAQKAQEVVLGAAQAATQVQTKLKAHNEARAMQASSLTSSFTKKTMLN